MDSKAILQLINVKFLLSTITILCNAVRLLERQLLCIQKVSDTLSISLYFLIFVLNLYSPKKSVRGFFGFRNHIINL